MKTIQIKIRTIPPPLEIAKREDIPLFALEKPIEAWLNSRYRIVQEGNRHAIYAILLFFYFNSDAQLNGCQIRKNLKLNNIDLRKTETRRGNPKDKSRRFDAGLNDLEYMTVLSRDGQIRLFKVKLRKDWLSDKIILEKWLKEINPNLSLKVGGSLDGIFTEIAGGIP